MLEFILLNRVYVCINMRICEADLKSTADDLLTLWSKGSNIECKGLGFNI